MSKSLGNVVDPSLITDGGKVEIGPQKFNVGSILDRNNEGCLLFRCLFCNSEQEERSGIWCGCAALVGGQTCHGPHEHKCWHCRH